jgi:hypothetical protein
LDASLCVPGLPQSATGQAALLTGLNAPELMGRHIEGFPPPYEKLRGDLSGACSRRINIQHRLVYQVLDDIKTVKVIRMWTHYE